MTRDERYQCVVYSGGAQCISDGQCDCGGSIDDDDNDGQDDGDSIFGDDGNCSSMQSVSASQLTCTFPQLSFSEAVIYATAANSALGGSLLTNKCEWTAYLANVGTESNGLTEWIQTPSNCTTVAPYCGRGPLQLTGSSNYNYW